MIQKISCFDKPVIKVNAQDIANMMNTAAKQSNSYALKLMKAGIRHDLNDVDVIFLSEKDGLNMLDQSGELTDNGKKFIMSITKQRFNLKSEKEAEKITLRQYLNNMLRDFYIQDNSLYHQKQTILSELA